MTALISLEKVDQSTIGYFAGSRTGLTDWTHGLY